MNIQQPTSPSERLGTASPNRHGRTPVARRSKATPACGLIYQSKKQKRCFRSGQPERRRREARATGRAGRAGLRACSRFCAQAWKPALLAGRVEQASEPAPACVRRLGSPRYWPWVRRLGPVRRSLRVVNKSRQRRKPALLGRAGRAGLRACSRLCAQAWFAAA